MHTWGAAIIKPNLLIKANLDSHHIIKTKKTLCKNPPRRGPATTRPRSRRSSRTRAPRCVSRRRPGPRTRETHDGTRNARRYADCLHRRTDARETQAPTRNARETPNGAPIVFLGGQPTRNADFYKNSIIFKHSFIKIDVSRWLAS